MFRTISGFQKDLAEMLQKLNWGSSAGSNTNYLEVEEGGFIELHGTGCYYIDLDFPLVVRSTGTNIASETAVVGDITASQWQVGDYMTCTGREFPHGWKEGSNCTWHIHLITNGSDIVNTYLKFELQYAYANYGEVVTAQSTITTADLTIPAHTPDKTHLLFNLGNYTPSGLRIAAHVYPRLKRIASSGTAPTLDPWITMLQSHIICDTLGSRSIATK